QQDDLVGVQPAGVLDPHHDTRDLAAQQIAGFGLRADDRQRKEIHKERGQRRVSPSGLPRRGQGPTAENRQPDIGQHQVILSQVIAQGQNRRQQDKEPGRAKQWRFLSLAYFYDRE